MYKEHPSFPPVEESQRIWRYRKLERFEQILSTGCLFFCRVDRFDDPLEGALTKHDIRRYNKWDQHKLPSDRKGADIYNHLLEGKKQFFSKFHPGDMRQRSFANCWHVNEYESADMWKEYCDSEGVAIQSTFRRLTASFDEYDKDVFIGTVRYIDETMSAQPNGNSFDPVMAKRKRFVDENELRAVIWYPPAIPSIGYMTRIPISSVPEKGICVPVNLERLIEKIYVMPTDKPLLEEVESLIERYGLHKNCIKKSSL